MSFESTSAEGSTLFTAAAFRGASNNGAMSYVDRIKLAQYAADRYSTVLNEVSYILLVALGKVQPGEDGEGDPVSLAREAADALKAGDHAVKFPYRNTAV